MGLLTGKQVLNISNVSNTISCVLIHTFHSGVYESGIPQTTFPQPLNELCEVLRLGEAVLRQVVRVISGVKGKELSELRPEGCLLVLQLGRQVILASMACIHEGQSLHKEASSWGCQSNAAIAAGKGSFLFCLLASFAVSTMKANVALKFTSTAIHLASDLYCLVSLLWAAEA